MRILQRKIQSSRDVAVTVADDDGEQDRRRDVDVDAGVEVYLRDGGVKAGQE